MTARARSEPVEGQTNPPEKASMAEIVSADDPRLAELDRLATLLDSRFRVPVLGFRLGWDSLLGLIPGVGDAATLAPAAWLIWRGHRMGARRRTLARMAVNTGIDTVVGGIPVIGDLFDIAFKSNRRNVDLLRSELKNSTSVRAASAGRRWQPPTSAEGRAR